MYAHNTSYYAAILPPSTKNIITDKNNETVKAMKHKKGRKKGREIRKIMKGFISLLQECLYWTLCSEG